MAEKEQMGDKTANNRGEAEKGKRTKVWKSRARERIMVWGVEQERETKMWETREKKFGEMSEILIFVLMNMVFLRSCFKK